MNGPAYCPLDGFGLVRVGGADARDFLNAQLCSDVASLSPTLSGLSGYCNPKGRLLMCARLFIAGADYYLRLPRPVVADVVKRLKMFVLRSRVAIDACGVRNGRSDDWAPGFGVIADDLPWDTSEIPQNVNECAAGADRVIIRVPGASPHPPRYEIHGTAAANAGARDALAPLGEAADFTLWRKHDILAGLPSVYPETSGLFVPQMMNLDLIGALSYTKGCYPGQEVVARTHYIGKIKRRMVRFTSAHRPAPGDEVFVTDFSMEQASGSVVDAVSTDGGAMGLAVVRLAGLDTGVIHLNSADGPVAEQARLPYSPGPAA